jgi:hypothetical protein
LLQVFGGWRANERLVIDQERRRTHEATRLGILPIAPDSRLIFSGIQTLVELGRIQANIGSISLQVADT